MTVRVWAKRVLDAGDLLTSFTGFVMNVDVCVEARSEGTCTVLKGKGGGV